MLSTVLLVRCQPVHESKAGHSFGCYAIMLIVAEVKNCQQLINGTETCNYLWNSLEFPSLRRKEELNCWGHNDQNYAIRNKTCRQIRCVNCFLLELFPLYSSILDKSCTLGVGLYWKREKSKRKVVRKFWLLHESLFVLAQTLTVTQVQFKLFLIVGTIVHLRTVNVTC